MKSLTIDKYRVAKAALDEAVRVLASGGVVAFPTETSYGLAVDPTDSTGLKRLFALKGRSRTKSLPLIAADAAQVTRIARLNGAAARLARRAWPGPLTLILDAKKAPFDRLAKDGTVAVRVPGAAWARALAEAYGRPVTGTSANFTGEPPCYSGADVRRTFNGSDLAPDLLLDAGPIPERPASTIVRVDGDVIDVKREGAITLEQLTELLGRPTR